MVGLRFKVVFLQKGRVLQCERRGLIGQLDQCHDPKLLSNIASGLVVGLERIPTAVPLYPGRSPALAAAVYRFVGVVDQGSFRAVW